MSGVKYPLTNNQPSARYASRLMAEGKVADAG